MEVAWRLITAIGPKEEGRTLGPMEIASWKYYVSAGTTPQHPKAVIVKRMAGSSENSGRAVGIASSKSTMFDECRRKRFATLRTDILGRHWTFSTGTHSCSTTVLKGVSWRQFDCGGFGCASNAKRFSDTEGRGHHNPTAATLWQFSRKYEIRSLDICFYLVLPFLLCGRL